jgi:hypothetical protein
MAGLRVIPGTWRAARTGNHRAWQARMTARLLLASLVSLVLVAGTASAEPDSASLAPGLTPPAATPPAAQVADPPDHESQPGTGESEWYGVSILLVDGLIVGGSALALNMDSDDMFTAVAAAWVLGGPIGHLVHGEMRNAAISLGLRLGLPVLGGYLGRASAGDCWECNGPHGLGETIAGVLLGTLAASLLDMSVVARTRSTRKRVDTTAWAPQLGVSGSQVTAGVAGWF